MLDFIVGDKTFPKNSVVNVLWTLPYLPTLGLDYWPWIFGNPPNRALHSLIVTWSSWILDKTHNCVTVKLWQKNLTSCFFYVHAWPISQWWIFKNFFPLSWFPCAWLFYKDIMQLCYNQWVSQSLWCFTHSKHIHVTHKHIQPRLDL
jgi:hypothetical protein